MQIPLALLSLSSPFTAPLLEMEPLLALLLSADRLLALLDLPPPRPPLLPPPLPRPLPLPPRGALLPEEGVDDILKTVPQLNIELFF
jgi:hypothetical protein